MSVAEKKVQQNINKHISLKFKKLFESSNWLAIPAQLYRAFDDIKEIDAFICAATESYLKQLNNANDADKVTQLATDLAKTIKPYFFSEGQPYQLNCVDNDEATQGCLADLEKIRQSQHKLYPLWGFLWGAFFSRLMLSLKKDVRSKYASQLNAVKQSLLEESLTITQQAPEKTALNKTQLLGTILGFSTSLLILPITLLMAIGRGFYKREKVKNFYDYVFGDALRFPEANRANFFYGFQVGFFTPTYFIAVAAAKMVTWLAKPVTPIILFPEIEGCQQPVKIAQNIHQRISNQAAMNLGSAPKPNAKPEILNLKVVKSLAADYESEPTIKEFYYSNKVPEPSFFVSSPYNKLLTDCNGLPTATKSSKMRGFRNTALSFLPFNLIDSFDLFSILDMFKLCF